MGIEDTLRKLLRPYREEITDGVERKFSSSLKFPETLSVFRGHFPGHPVLPAVAQLVVVRLLCEAVLGKSLLIQDYYRVKFSATVAPEDRIQVVVRLLYEEGAEPVRISFYLTGPDGTAISSGELDCVEYSREK